MNVAFLIAKRYFFSKKKKSFINFIAIISMLGIGIGTMALVVILSVFNGLEDLNRQIFKSFDPDIKISLKEGKSFEIDKQKLSELKQTEGIAYVTEVIEDNALAIYENSQMVVNLKGVDKHFVENTRLKKSLVEGHFYLKKDSSFFALIGGNVYGYLNISLQNMLVPLQLWYPRNQKKISLNPDDNINQISLNIAGVYSLENTHDDYVFVPLEVAENLTELGSKRTALEIFVKTEKDIKKVQKKIKEIYGNQFNILNSDEQNRALFRAVKIERIFVFIALILIIGIASINILSSLTMLAIDKKDDIITLKSIGYEKRIIQNIFLNEGAIIALTGAGIGLFLGWLICFIQEKFGIIKMGMKSAIIDHYPVKIQFLDFLLTAISIIIITLIVSYFPARKAADFLKK
jgi:lipoprotein-releasing system permease protein